MTTLAGIHQLVFLGLLTQRLLDFGGILVVLEQKAKGVYQHK